ncbi:amidohydrolase family protein [Actinoplanes sp. NPDC051851]|uniref:amidohydrolase family protein n=1 Tax=Actinoplanes sp. NPDC051851 TaxID=3154753 RepID=UPI00341E7EBE
MTLIAIEEHWIMPELTAALRDSGDESLAFNDLGDHRERLRDLGAGRIAAMDAQGIDVAVLALTPPGTQPLAPDAAIRLSRAANDRAAEAVAAHPSRFRALSTLPMSAPDAVAPGAIVAELERAAGLGHVGTMVHARAGDLLLDDPAYDDFFAACARLGQPVFLHPQLPSRAVRDASYRGFTPTTDLALATFGWGWHLDTATAALRLILRGTVDRHPALQIILGHWGEMLLFWLDRADSLSRVAGLPRPIRDYIRTNFFITTSGMHNPALLDHALSVTTPDRLLFSTDYPFQHPTGPEIAAFLQHFPTEEARTLFTAENAAALFGIDLPVTVKRPG